MKFDENLNSKTRMSLLFKRVGIYFLFFSLSIVFFHPFPLTDEDHVPIKPLELRFFFPDQEQERKEIYLFRPQRISSGKSWMVYISCIGDHSIFKFDDQGRFVKKIGREGQGPGEFQGPNHAVPWRDKLIVLDNFSRKFQILDPEGKYLSSFISKSTYWDFVVSESGLIYAAPLLFPFPGKKEKDLIYVYTQEGDLKISFGKPIYLNSNIFNKLRLAVRKNKEILAAFDHWPEVRKYSLKGELINVYTIHHPVMAERAQFNRKQMNAPRKPGKPIRTKPCIEDIEVLEDRIFLLFRSHKEPVLEILECDPDMNITAKYRYKSKKRILSGDFFVKKKDNDLYFYLLSREKDRIIVLAERL